MSRKKLLIIVLVAVASVSAILCYLYISGQEPVKGYLDMLGEFVTANYILFLGAGAVGLFILFALFIISRTRGKQPEPAPQPPAGPQQVSQLSAPVLIPPAPPPAEHTPPSVPRVIPKGIKLDEDEKERILEIVKELESRVNKIRIESLRERERRWYNMVRMQIVDAKTSVEMGEFDRVSRNLGNIELFMKMIELHTTSKLA